MTIRLYHGLIWGMQGLKHKYVIMANWEWKNHRKIISDQFCTHYWHYRRKESWKGCEKSWWNVWWLKPKFSQGSHDRLWKWIVGKDRENRSWNNQWKGCWEVPSEILMKSVWKKTWISSMTILWKCRRDTVNLRTYTIFVYIVISVYKFS